MLKELSISLKKKPLTLGLIWITNLNNNNNNNKPNKLLMIKEMIYDFL